MISTKEIDHVLSPVYDEIANVAPLLAAAPYWLVKRTIADMRKRTEATVAAQLPSLDETTVTRIVDAYFERVEERIELVCKIVGAGGRS
jgi:hypothetical protein